MASMLGSLLQAVVNLFVAIDHRAELNARLVDSASKLQGSDLDDWLRNQRS